MRRYWRGCRCRKCRIENALYTSNRREALRADASVTVPHGTDRGYTAFACRCDVCTRAHAVAVRKNREVRRKTDPTTWHTLWRVDDWFDARCVGHGDLFYDEATPESVARAKALCAFCPLREQCLDDATQHSDYNGIWGGTLPSERMTDGVEHGTPRGYGWHLRQRKRDPTHRACGSCLRAHAASSRERQSRYREQLRQRDL